MKRQLLAVMAGVFAGLLAAAFPLWNQQRRAAATAMAASRISAVPPAKPGILQKLPLRETSPHAGTSRSIANRISRFSAEECREALEAALAAERKDLLLPLMCRWAELEGSEAFAWLDEHIGIWVEVLPDAASVWAAGDPPACADWLQRAWKLIHPKPENASNVLKSPIWRTLLQHDLRSAIRVAGNLCIDSPVGAPLSRNDLRPAIRSVADLQSVGAEILAHPEWLEAFDTENPLYLLVALRECWQEIDPDGWDRWAAAHPAAAAKSDNQPVPPGLKFLRNPDWAAAATEALTSAAPEKLDEVSTGIVQLWGDMAAAGQWVNAQPDGPVKNAAAQAYALEAVKEDPGAALLWADAITDAAARGRTQRRVFTAWHAADPAAAAAWLPQSGWSAAQQQAARDIMAAAPPERSGR